MPGWLLPAHDYNLKCSHLFNVLDTRGAIGVTERAQYFGRMRRIANKVSTAYVEQRQQLEYPFADNPLWAMAETVDIDEGALIDPAAVAAQIGDTARFVLEIGGEELPAADLTSAIGQLRTAARELLADLRLSYDALEVEGTPRRLALIVDGLAGRQTDMESVAKGPPADRAYDAQGNAHAGGRRLCSRQGR